MGNVVGGVFAPVPVNVVNAVLTYIRGGLFGHDLYTEMIMNFAAGGAGADCTFQWWERSDNPPAWYPAPANTPFVWNDMFAILPASFAAWNGRVVPCPAGGPLTVTDYDPPGLAIWPGRTKRRVLDLRATVLSGGGCACAFASKSALGTQTLELVNGAITVHRFNVVRQNF